MSTVDAVLGEVVARHFADGSNAGLAIVATDTEGVLLERYEGWADRAAGVPVTPDTVFQIGSISKVAAAVLAVQQVEAGRLDLHVPIRNYLQWLPESPYGTVTAHQLLSHTAGLAAGSDVSPPSPYMAFTEHAEPGEFHYSNVGFQVMGMVLAAITGQPYPSLLADALLQPLEMSASFAAITDAARATMAVGYVPSPDDRPFLAGDGLVPAPFFSYPAADGNLACTGRDLAAFARMLARGGANVLSRTGFEVLTTPVADTGDDEWVCYGVFAKDSYGYPDLNHGGSMVGYSSMLCVDRETGIGVVALNNGAGDPTPAARALLKALRQQRRGEPVDVPQPPQPSRLDDYAGTYRGGGEERAVHVQDGKLCLGGKPLAWITADGFALPGSPYAVRFGRQEGAVVELSHGPGHWVTEEYTGDAGRGHPPEWDAYQGQYRAHKPFEPTFRIVIRNGTLLLVRPWGAERRLVPTEEPATFRLDDTLEVISFDTPAGPQMLRAVLSGCPHYRPLT